jgi:hypothetical protein
VTAKAKERVKAKAKERVKAKAKVRVKAKVNHPLNHDHNNELIRPGL